MKDRKSIFELEDNQPDHVLPKAENAKLKDISLMLKNMEKTIKLSLESLNNKLSSKILDLEKTQAEQFIKINSLSVNLNPDKDNNDKIIELVAFKKKMNDQIISHEFKLTQLQKELSNATYKYDRMYLDNLIIPGTIGDYCRYRNLKEYLEYNITQVQNLNSYKEKNQLDLKNYKEKLDMMIKNLKTQIESIEQNSNNYTLKTVQDAEAKFKKEYERVDEKFNEVRMENNKYSVQLQKQASEISIDYEKLLTIKSEIIGDFDSKVDLMQILHKKTYEEFDELRIEYEKIKAKFNDLSDFLREAKKPQNLNTSVKDMRKLSSKLSFSESKNALANSSNLRKSFANNNNDSISMDENNTSLQNAKNVSNFSFKPSNNVSANFNFNNNFAAASKLSMQETKADFNFGNNNSNNNHDFSNKSLTGSVSNLRLYADGRSLKPQQQAKLANSSFDNKNNVNNNSGFLAAGVDNSNFNGNGNSNNLVNHLNKNVNSNTEISGNFKYQEDNIGGNSNNFNSGNQIGISNNNNSNFTNMIMTSDENKKSEITRSFNNNYKINTKDNVNFENNNNNNNDIFNYYISNNKNKAFNNQDLNFEIKNNNTNFNSNNNYQSIKQNSNNPKFKNSNNTMQIYDNINNQNNSTRNKFSSIKNTNSDNSSINFNNNNNANNNNNLNKTKNSKRTKNLKENKPNTNANSESENINNNYYNPNKNKEDLNNNNNDNDDLNNKNSSEDSFSQEEEIDNNYNNLKNEKGKWLRNKPLTATGRKAFNIVYYIRNYSIDVFEKNEKEDFLKKQKSISELYKHTDRFEFLNEIIFIFNEFNDSLSFFRKEFIKKITNTDQRIIQVENFWKKKMEELTFKIKNYLPINFNPYLKNYGLPEIENEELSILQKEEKFKRMLKNKMMNLNSNDNKENNEAEKFIFASNNNFNNFKNNALNQNNLCVPTRKDNYSQGKLVGNLENEKAVNFSNNLYNSNIFGTNFISNKEISNCKSAGFNLPIGKNLGNLAESLNQVNFSKQNLLFDVKKRSKERRNLHDVICNNLYDKNELPMNLKREDLKIKEGKSSEVNTDRTEKLKEKRKDKSNKNIKDASSLYIANGTINKNENQGSVSTRVIKAFCKNSKSNVDFYKKDTLLKNNMDLIDSAATNLHKNYKN